jgi:hypothetical protein
MITLVHNNSPSLRKAFFVYRFDAAESKYGNEIAPSPTISRTEAAEFRYHIFM